MDARTPKNRFDRAYYERFYEDPRTRVTSEQGTACLADFVLAYLAHLGQPVKRVVDLGCGLGYWRTALSERRPTARYTGVEVSGYLCERYGWKQDTVESFSARAPFDLVICQGVLQYLDDETASLALDNLARLCRGALYLEALSSEDWEQNVDQELTDGDVHLRPATFYRERLAKRFRNAGGGVFIHEDSPAALFELEKVE